MSDFCYDCKYHSSVNGMSACAWKTGLASSYVRCEHYERDWGTALLPFVFIGAFLILFIRMIIIGIWGI